MVRARSKAVKSFRPILQRQRDDAAAKDQTGRQDLFDRLLTRIDDEAS
jgi:hypothetical protein